MHGRMTPTFRGVLQKMRYGFLIGLVLLLGLAAGCSDDDNGGVMPPPPPPPPVTMFVDSGTPAVPDGVRMEGTVIGDEVEVRIVIDGATMSQDLYAFAFDIQLSDPSVAQFKPGSAVFGDALVDTAVPPAPAQGQLTVVSQQGDRVIVGVSKTNRGLGNGIAAGEKTVLSMRFTVNAGTTDLTFVDSPANPVDSTNEPAALDPDLEHIDTIDFDPLSATISR